MVQMACRALEANRVRCQQMVEGAGFCRHHQDSPVIGSPEMILLKPRLNQKWVSKFLEAGVERAQRSLQREQALDKARSIEARQLGRDPQQHRHKPDSGTPVFGSKGLTPGVALRELHFHGYEITKLFLQQKEGERMGVLVVEFSKSAPLDLDPDVWEVLETLLLHVSWDHLHVWSNPLREDGTRVDTVQLSHRQPDRRPKYYLDFDEGAWNVSPVA